MKNDTLKQSLQAFNDLLVRERRAIAHLRMSQLHELQHEKIELMKVLNQQEDAVDEEEKAVIESIKKNNERNRMLLESGLKLVKRLQDNTFRRTLTYAPLGRSMQIGVGPRVLNRSV
nr:hypothetical protein [uncultured Desulfobulbus sp.]